VKKYIKMAWRNIWRNKRRTIITIASIFFAMLLSLVMRSFQKGTYSHMVNNVVQSYSGYIQVQDIKYWNEKIIDNSLAYSEDVIEKINAVENVTLAVPRLESFALASSGNNTKGVLVMGIDPEAEDELTLISK